QQAEKDANGGGFAGAVEAEEAENAAARDREVDTAEDGLLAKGFGEAGDFDRGVGHGEPPVSRVGLGGPALRGLMDSICSSRSLRRSSGDTSSNAALAAASASNSHRIARRARRLSGEPLPAT